MSLRMTVDTLVLPGAGRQPNLDAVLAGITTRDREWKRTGTCVCRPLATKEADEPPQPRRTVFLLADPDLDSPSSNSGSEGEGGLRMPEDNTPHPNLLRRRRSIFASPSRQLSPSEVGSQPFADEEDDSAWAPPEATLDRRRLLKSGKKSSRRLRKHVAAVEAAQRMQLANEAEFRRVKDAALMKAADRSPKQVERLAKFFQKSERLRDFEFSVLRECARIVEPLPLAQGRAVYWRGDPAREFYVVVDGELVQRSSEDAGDGDLDTTDTTFVPMSTFGEKELLADIPREHTVQCSSTKCVLVWLSQSNFQDILAGNMAAAFKEEITKVKRLSEFQEMEDNVLTGFIFCFQEEEYEAGEVVVFQGEKMSRYNRMLWITSGTVSCYMDPCYDADDAEAVASASQADLIYLCDVGSGGVVGDHVTINTPSTRHIVAQTKVTGLSVSAVDIKRRFPRDILGTLQSVATQRVERDNARRERELQKAAKFAMVVAEGNKWRPTAKLQSKAFTPTAVPSSSEPWQPVSHRAALTSAHEVVTGRGLWMLKVSEDSEGLEDGRVAKRDGQPPDAISLRASTARKRNKTISATMGQSKGLVNRGGDSASDLDTALGTSVFPSSSGRAVDTMAGDMAQSLPLQLGQTNNRGRWIRNVGDDPGTVKGLFQDVVLSDPVLNDAIAASNDHNQNQRWRGSGEESMRGKPSVVGASDTEGSTVASSGVLLPIHTSQQPNVAAAFTRSLHSQLPNKQQKAASGSLHQTVEIKPGETALQALEQLPSIASDTWHFGTRSSHQATTETRTMDNFAATKGREKNQKLPRLRSCDYPTTSAVNSPVRNDERVVGGLPALSGNRNGQHRRGARRRHSSDNPSSSNDRNLQQAGTNGGLEGSINSKYWSNANWGKTNSKPSATDTGKQPSLLARVAAAAMAAERSKAALQRQMMSSGAANPSSSKEATALPLLSPWMSLAEYRTRADTRLPNARMARA